ncbi:hypothetical protein BDN71DRAFT_1436335 [Pleurotus eryngii]|uniref:Uncharacterized protein n=1 Tax=Pleurotus eryngii TaxID=5323 RepID=A0A9P6D9Y3_PLEER|nr:hypothetical protein BDN71DRAFT_1436335 [Pleurotus eryngii]
MNGTALPAQQDGYSAQNIVEDPSKSSCGWSVDKLCAQGFTLVEWDGHTLCPFVDSQGQVFAVLTSRAKGELFDSNCQQAYKAMAVELPNFDLKEAEKDTGEATTLHSPLVSLMEMAKQCLRGWSPGRVAHAWRDSLTS